jgi:hypothetical protein
LDFFAKNPKNKSISPQGDFSKSQNGRAQSIFILICPFELKKWGCL